MYRVKEHQSDEQQVLPQGSNNQQALSPVTSIWQAHLSYSRAIKSRSSMLSGANGFICINQPNPKKAT